MSLNPNPGQIKKKDLDEAFLSAPGADLVGKLMLQISKIPNVTKLFGPYKADAEGQKNSDQQRWADYNRMDWSSRQLPVINVFEAGAESKQSDNSYITGVINIQIYWPSSFRRSDLARVPETFKGVLQNFFASELAYTMLDELYYIQRPEKVYGLNEIGKSINWSPNVEGLVENDLVPVTILEVGYRIDLRAWYRALEFMGRTQAKPFEVTLESLNGLDGAFDGVPEQTDEPVIVSIDGTLNNVTNP